MRLLGFVFEKVMLGGAVLMLLIGLKHQIWPIVTIFSVTLGFMIFLYYSRLEEVDDPYEPG